MNVSELKWLTPGAEWDGEGDAPLSMLLATAGVVAVLVPCILAWLFGPPHSPSPSPFHDAGRGVALVIAHPDDEAMFFWPALLELRRAGVPLSILCLSTGNADGLGAVRTAEMERSCARLQVTGKNLRILDVEELQDGFRAWPEDVVARHVQKFVEDCGASLILTFDDHGVSGHPNHVSTSLGVRRAHDTLCNAGGTASCKVLMLESVGLARKYIGPLSLWLDSAPSANDGRPGVVCSGCGPATCLLALAVHWSQLVWYRVLFTLFSRYAYVNSFVQHKPTTPEPCDRVTTHEEQAG
uniref:N-acetylglucosaminylphosphatidylinositol deacetylase n=1 Tax=Pyrodinium bahamense TaxID=73915 RepID=A0A7S0AKN3_9DINO